MSNSCPLTPQISQAYYKAVRDDDRAEIDSLCDHVRMGCTECSTEMKRVHEEIESNPLNNSPVSWAWVGLTLAFTALILTLLAVAAAPLLALGGICLALHFWLRKG